MHFLLNKGELVEMKFPVSSVINAPAYQRHRAQRWKQWIILVILVLVSALILFSLIFDATLRAKESTAGQLSLTAQAETFKQVINPGSILFGLIFLVLIAYSAIRYVHLQGLVEPASNTIIDMNEMETGSYPFGPGFVNAGVRNIIILKNYQGFLRILRPTYPTQKNLYFFTSSEKVDQSINLQTQSLSMQIFCRTLEGIPIVFPSVQIQYKFMLNIPGNNRPSPQADSKADLEMVKNYLLRKGNFSDQEIIRFYSDLVISQILRKTSLDELNGVIRTNEKSITEEKIVDHLAGIKRYKINALSKHWRNKKMLPTLAEQHHPGQFKTHNVKSHRKQYHPAQKGKFTFPISSVDGNVSTINPSLNIEEKIKTSLERELQKFNLILVSLQISTWQPAELLIKQKIKQTHEKKAELFLNQKTLNAYQTIRSSKNTCLDSLRQPSYTIDMSSSTPAQQVLANVKTYKIPNFQAKNDQKDNMGLE